MAFNFRPTNANEIVNKKKKHSETASLIYDFVKKEYGETIILDPTTDFRSVKIPRAAEQKASIANIKRKMNAKFPLTGVTVSFGNGSGTGGSNMNAADTAMQENATRFVCEQFIDGSPAKMPSGDKIAKIYPKYDDDWHDTFNLQATKLKSWLGNNKGYEYSRDAQDGMMHIIENIALNKCGVSTKDSWNPADIYICKKSSKAEIKKEVTRIGNLTLPNSAKLDMLNEYMRKKFKTRELVGISLKKLGKTASIEETNVSKLQPLTDISIIKGSFKLDLDLAANGEFKTGELKFKIMAEGKEVNVQVRAFSGGVRESTQMDMTGAGAAAKLGKVSAREAIDPFLTPMALKRRMGTNIPKVGEFTEVHIKDYVDEVRRLKLITIGGSVIDFGTDNWETTLRKAITLEKENNRTASQLSAKLQCFQWINILKEVEKKGKLTEFLSVLYFGAKKQYDSAGPFLKIS